MHSCFPNLKQVNHERGSVMVLSIGLMVVALLVVTLSVNIATMWVTRRNLDGIADSAALAAAQAVDGQALYQGTAMQGSESLPLNRIIARRYVADYLANAQVRKQYPNIRVRSVAVVNNRVRIVIATPVSLPFGYLLGSSTPLVVSAATAVQLTG